MLLLALLTPANAATHEVYAGTHVDVQSAENHVGVGFTGQLGYRLHLGRFTVGAAANIGSLHDPFTGVELEGGLHLRHKAKVYKPWIGVESVGHFADPQDLSTYAALSPNDLRVAVRPLVFHAGPISLSAMELSYGELASRDAWRNAFGMNLFQLGVLL